MKKIIYTLGFTYLLCFDTINAQFVAGVDISVSSPDPLTISVEFTGNDNFTSVPFNNWNSPLFAIRWPIISGVTTTNQVASIANSGDGFPFSIDSSTPTGVDGGDGFYYQKFTAVVFKYNFNIAMGETKTVATITLNSNGDTAAVDFELVDSTNAWVIANSAEPTIPNAALGEKFDDFSISSANVLPIKLERFTASKVGTDVLLDWVSDSEINVFNFEIERSHDHNSWTVIGKIKAQEEKKSITEYHFLDNQIPLIQYKDPKSTFRYRIKTVKEEEPSQYSEVKSITFDPIRDIELEVYPNPSSEKVFINLTGKTLASEKAELNIYNSQGQLVKNTYIKMNSDNQVDVGDLNKGAYLFLVKHGLKIFKKKFIKPN